jgi:hypothetical protein
MMEGVAMHEGEVLFSTESAKVIRAHGCVGGNG